MSGQEQNFQNHARFVPAYHLWATGLLMLPALYFGFLAVTGFTVERLAVFAFSVGVVVIALFARIFPLGVQDRVIRLEERMRLERLLSDNQRGRIMEFTTEQLIALRFASDEELSELAAQVLERGMADRKEIKQAVKVWRADNQRI